MNQIAQTAAATSGKPPVASAAAKADVRTVKMKDGRVVDFPGKRRLQKTVTLDGGKVSVKLDFETGETFTCQLPEALLLRAAGHGLSQKLGDEISGVKDIDDAVEAVDDLIGRIAKGEWNETASGGEGLAGASVLMKALIEHTGKSREEVKNFLSARTPKEKAAMREAKGIKEIVARIEAEKAANAKKKDSGPAIDTASLLAGLTSGAPVAGKSSVFDNGPGAKPQNPAAAPKPAPR